MIVDASDSALAFFANPDADDRLGSLGPFVLAGAGAFREDPAAAEPE